MVGHMQMQDKDEAMRKILQVAVDGKRNRARPKPRWWDLVKDDMARNQMTTKMAEDRKHSHVMIRAGTLQRVEAERWESQKRNHSLLLDEYIHSIKYKKSPHFGNEYGSQ